MADPTENPQARFEMAWKDLAERLAKGAANLRSTAATMREQSNKDRLIDKAAGVEDAIEIWEDLAAGAMGRSGDYAGMWRSFTDLVEARLAATGMQPGYYQGIYLALDYQRGYGADVDAPRPTRRPA